jgi:alpha-L-fucosidase
MNTQKPGRRFYQYFNYCQHIIISLSLAALFLTPFKASAVLQDSVWVVTFTPGESLESKLKKAAHVRPSPAQIKWMERGRNVFMHYGMNTFHNDDWGTGAENPKDFNPTLQDPAQWAKVIKDAKFSMVVPTAKHHDGFCIWNTASTDHSINNASVTTDVMDELAKGCKAQGVDLGIYLSPWDRNQNIKGVWRTDAYNTVFLKQLKELLGGKYGSIGELWFDGACGDEPTFKNLSWYRTKDWYDTIEALQPMAVIRLYDGFYFSGSEKDSSEWVGIKQGTKKLQWRGKEIRWCGNEGGYGREDESCLLPIYTRFFGGEVQNTNPDPNSLAGESKYNNALAAVWYQSEVNTSMCTHWFYHADNSKGQIYGLRSLNDLKTIYYNSTGNNGGLLLNLIADNRGLITNDQITLLKTWNNWIDSSFTKNWAMGATATSSVTEVKGHEANKIIDNKRHSYWTPDGAWDINSSNATITFDLKAATTFDHIMLKEYVYNGQRVAGWNVKYFDGSTWKPLRYNNKDVAHKFIGYKRICKCDQVTTSKIQLNITRAWDTPEISDFALYKTLSGVDNTPEDTAHPIIVAVEPTTKMSSISIKPKIVVTAHQLTIDVMDSPISKVEITRLDGRLIPSAVMINGSQAVSKSLTAGVYLVRIQAGMRTLKSTIVVPK